jgi:hypothetical protein
MEKQENLQPRGSLDEKPPLERLESEEKQHNVEALPPCDEETSTTDETPKDTGVTEKEKEWEYITGLKLALVIIAITLACFLMLLDNSILSTVCNAKLSLNSISLHTQ